MASDYSDLVLKVLTQPETAAQCRAITEKLLVADPFNQALIFVNGMADCQLFQITANTICCVDILKSAPVWISSTMAAETSRQLQKHLLHPAYAVALKECREASLVRYPVIEMDYARTLNQYSASELCALSSSDINEYGTYRDLFDLHQDEVSVQSIPAFASDETLGYDIKFEQAKLPGKPLVIFFQGFLSMLCPPNLRIPSFQGPFSQIDLCKRVDPDRQLFNRLFVRDDFQVWYQAGLHGRGSAHTLARQLAAMIRLIAPSRVITYGTSAGGFASLLFGHLLGASTSISFSPQTLIFEDSPDLYYTPYRRLFHDRFLKGRPYLCSDIARLGPLCQRARVFYSLEEEDDRFHAERLARMANVELIGRHAKTHAGYLDKKLADSQLLYALRGK